MTEDSKFFLGEQELERADLDGVQVVRDPSGVWLYENSWIAVPGARDVTLTERFEPKFIISGEGSIDRVVIDAASIHVFPELLDWCWEAGTPVQHGDELLEVLVPIDQWEKHDRIPGELISPEHHGSEAEQEVARAEREYREAELLFDAATEARAEALRRRASEMTRQEARQITGLSVGRIQQLIRDAPLDPVEREVLELFELGPIETWQEFRTLADQSEVPTDGRVLMRTFASLQERGLLQEGGEHGLELSKEGMRVLREAQLGDIEAAEPD